MTDIIREAQENRRPYCLLIGKNWWQMNKGIACIVRYGK